MYNTLFFAALFAATAVSGVFAAFSIDTPTFTQCQPATLSWSQGQGPYRLVIVDSKDPCGDVILDLGEFKETSISWTVQLPVHAAISLYIEDSGTQDAWSGSINVLASNDQTCIPASVRHYYNIPDSTPTPTPGSAGKAGNGTYVHLFQSLHSTDFFLIIIRLVVTPTFSVSPNHTPNATPIGAANAGTNPLENGAVSMRHVGTPLATIGAFVAAIYLIL
ncbi:hypothetical protein M378DRAFT_73290 [Amanita muscaria Koide BX008]|uniref:Uncharacterized protein n=1 Tax=Amanita muscaria (strain Koide BX008) TaxID=946122 RepID=A0A0C2X0C2_AMAMK|nr:hypothetical protein M378DRAFT_73290 [Amanita muscaria Koide BX008]